MKVAHVLMIKPGRSGLYASAWNLIAAERRLGIDARMVPYMFATALEDDRGVPVADQRFAEDADVVVSHSGSSKDQLLSGKPIVVILHGNPEYCFQLDLQGKINSFYSTFARSYHHPIYSAFVTFYPQHLPYWSLTLPEDRLRLINPPCDLDRWKRTDTSYDFHGNAGEINVVAADTWRPTKIPYDTIHGFATWAKQHEGAKLHLYGCWQDRLPIAWSVVLEGLDKRGQLGELVSWSNHLDDVYSSADMTIIPDRIAANTMRESMACGCPVVAHSGSIYAQESADTRNPVEFAEAMERLWKRVESDGRDEVASDVRAKAEDSFSADQAAATLAEILEDAATQGNHPFTIAKTWRDNGLKFECQKCGQCCKVSGSVLFEIKEAVALARHLGLSLDEMMELYPFTRYGGIVQLSAPNGCPFLKDNKCSIYSVRPMHCRSYPFWSENTTEHDAWLVASEQCKGIGCGSKVNNDEIEERVSTTTQLRSAYIHQRKTVEAEQLSLGGGDE